MTVTERGLRALCWPESVAVLGASADPNKFGGRVVQFLTEYGYPGRVFPIHRREPLIQGMRASPRLADVGEPIDQVVVSVSAADAVEGIEAAAAVGARSAVIFSGGFAEAGVDGVRTQERLALAAREAGMRILGPNCMGLINVRAKLYATFTLAFRHAGWRPGSLGVVSQSGAFGAHLLCLAADRDVPLSVWMTTGNEADVDAADGIAYCAADPDTRVIAVYLETCRDGARWIEACMAAWRARKPIVLLRAGRSAGGRRTAASHTGAMALDTRVFDDVCAQFGVLTVETIEEMIDVVYACASVRWPRSRRVGLATVSGGVGALMVDAAEGLGLELPELAAADQERLAARLPVPAAMHNPVDMTAHMLQDITIVGDTLSAFLADARFDSVVVFLTMLGHSPTMCRPLCDVLGEVRRRHADQLVALAILGPESVVRELEALGYLVFADPTRALRVIAALARYQGSSADAAGAAGVTGDTPRKAVRSSYRSIPRRPLTEVEAAAIVQSWGVPIAPSVVVQDAETAARAAGEMGFPIVLKILSPDIPHKSDVGGVIVGVRSMREAQRGFQTLLRRVRKLRPLARLGGVLVVPQETVGVEMMLGASWDPTFGQVIALATGGPLVEVLDDVAFRRPPISIADARGMIEQLRVGRRLLAGVRGAPPADVEALAECVSRFSEAAAAQDDWRGSVDINPLWVQSAGYGCVALDVLITPAE